MKEMPRARLIVHTKRRDLQFHSRERERKRGRGRERERERDFINPQLSYRANNNKAVIRKVDNQKQSQFISIT